MDMTSEAIGKYLKLEEEAMRKVDCGLLTIEEAAEWLLKQMRS